MSTLLKRFLDMGVTDLLSFEEKKKIRLLNLGCMIALPILVTFFCINISQGLYLLALHNLFFILGNSFYLYINYKHRYQFARLLLSFISTVFFSFGAVYFQNGSEYFLLMNLIAVSLLFHKHKIAKAIIIWDALLFIGVKIYITENPPFYVVPEIRTIFSLSIATLLIVTCILYFSHEHYTYLRIVEENSQELVLQKFKLEEKTQQLEAMNTTKEKLFSIVAHDMRSPIANLKSALMLSNRNVISVEEFQSISAALVVQVDQLQNNLDNLLQWSRAQLNGIQTNKEIVNISAFLDEVTALFQSNITSKQLQLNTNCKDDIYASADIDHVKLILRNLLSNAIKFSFVGGVIQVNVQTTKTSVVITIKDFGKGMNEETLQHLFLLENTTSTYGTLNEKGTGLGLMLCKEFIEKNGGSITAESSLGEGSSFTFSLPIAKKIPAEAAGINI
jgi:two-component system sensor histidine kinase/response regulator